MTGPILALDVGGTKLAAGVVESDGTVRSFCMTPANAVEGPDRMIERLIALGRDALADAEVAVSDIPAIGIACGGPLDPGRGVIQDPPNLPGWHDIPLTARIEDVFGVRAFVDNDATAAAIAEWLWGAGKGRDSLVYLTISTGIGGGVIANGRPLRGRSGNAAELGHLSLRFDDWSCPCGRRGCPEAFASGTNIARRAREALAATEVESSLRTATDATQGIAGQDRTGNDVTPHETGSLRTATDATQGITARHVAEHAAAGDPLAREVWDATTVVIGELVATCLNAFDPDIVILGGGVTRAGDQLLRPVTQRAHQVAMAPFRQTPIVLSPFGEQLAALAAAAVAVDRLGELTREESPA